MTVYLVLNATVLLVIVLCVSLLSRKLHWRAVCGSLVFLLVLTAVFDSLIVSSGIVAYNPERILGMRIGSAPIEDFAYTVAAVLAIPALWHAFKKESGNE